MALTEDETKELVRLLEKLEWPLDPHVFHALVGKVVTVPQELSVINEENRILTFYRKDGEYDGHHQPGTVLRNNETVQQALERLKGGELAGAEIEPPKNIGWVEIPQGNGFGENPTRHEVSLLWLARIKEYSGPGTFSPLNQLPNNTLPHHKLIALKVQEHLRTRRLILGG